MIRVPSAPDDFIAEHNAVYSSSLSLAKIARKNLRSPMVGPYFLSLSSKNLIQLQLKFGINIYCCLAGDLLKNGLKTVLTNEKNINITSFEV